MEILIQILPRLANARGFFVVLLEWMRRIAARLPDGSPEF
jgi:hypothetical protein